VSQFLLRQVGSLTENGISFDITTSEEAFGTADKLRLCYKNQELDSVTKLQLVQPLSFGDMVLCYHRKIKHLILGRYCRYLRSSRHLNGWKKYVKTPLPPSQVIPS
jgi:hypothetical protein